MRIGATKCKEEIEAATDAKAALGGLTPESAPSDRSIFVLRFAANVATRAAHLRLERRKALNELRSQAAKSLNAVCRLLELRRLEQNSIDAGKAAVQAWLEALLQEDGD